MPRLVMIKRMSTVISDGHQHVASIYKSLAEDTSIEEDKAAYMEAAAAQAEMADRSLQIVVPNDAEEEVLNG